MQSISFESLSLLERWRDEVVTEGKRKIPRKPLHGGEVARRSRDGEEKKKFLESLSLRERWRDEVVTERVKWTTNLV